MLCSLLLLLACGAKDAPQIDAASGRVLVVDARGVASCAPGLSMRCGEDGALELGAGARAALRIPGRMALECVGPASCEWTSARVRLLRADEAGWDWRGEPRTMELWDGLSLQGGPGAYALRADARGIELRVHAGAPLELRQGARLLACVESGGVLRVGREAWSAPSATAGSWSIHDWPYPAQAAPAQPDPVAAVDHADWWSPSPWRCAAPAAPPRFAAVRVETVVAEAQSRAASPTRVEPPASTMPDPNPPGPRVVETPPVVAAAPATIAVQPVEPLDSTRSMPPARAAPASTRPAARWPRWFARPALLVFARLEALHREGRALLARYEAQRAFGVRFDMFAPFDVELRGDRLTLLLHQGASRVETVRGTSLLEVPPGAAVVLRRGGGLESYAGAVVVRPLRRR